MNFTLFLVTLLSLLLSVALALPNVCYTAVIEKDKRDWASCQKLRETCGPYIAWFPTCMAGGQELVGGCTNRYLNFKGEGNYGCNKYRCREHCRKSGVCRWTKEGCKKKNGNLPGWLM